MHTGFTHQSLCGAIIPVMSRPNTARFEGPQAFGMERSRLPGAALNGLPDSLWRNVQVLGRDMMRLLPGAVLPFTLLAPVGHLSCTTGVQPAWKTLKPREAHCSPTIF